MVHRLLVGAPEDFYQALGERLKKARKSARLTQEDLASAVGISRTSVANMEAGRQHVSVHLLAQFADRLGLSVSDLTPPLPAQSGLAERDSKYGDLTPEQQRWVARVLSGAEGRG